MDFRRRLRAVASLGRKLGRKAKARDRYDRAKAAYEHTLSRGDTRAQHTAFRALLDANSELLRTGA